MRNVPASVTAGWEAQAKTGNARPVVRAIVKKQHLRRYEYDTAWAPGGDYNDRHRAGHFASFIFGDNSGYIEIEKTFEGRRPRTWIAATPAGRKALAEEIAALREIVSDADGREPAAKRSPRAATG